MSWKNDEWKNDPGKRLYEAEGLNREERLIDVYRAAWKKRYGDVPVIEGRSREVFEQLAKTFSYEKATRIIEHYTTMNVPKFVESAHDPIQLKWNLNLVVAAVSSKQAKGLPSGMRIMTPDEVLTAYLKESTLVQERFGVIRRGDQYFDTEGIEICDLLAHAQRVRAASGHSAGHLESESLSSLQSLLDGHLSPEGPG